MTTTVTVVSASVEVAERQAAIAKGREASFNLPKARGLARRLVRLALKGQNKIKGMPKPLELAAIAERLKQGQAKEDIATELRLPLRVVEQAERYENASVAERESRTYEAHASIVDDVANMAYIVWYRRNYLEWGARCERAALKLETAKPYTMKKAVHYAHADYWREMRGGKVTGQKRNRKEHNAEMRLYTIASAIGGKACKGSARTIVGDLPASLGEKAQTVARLLSSGCSSADVADLLEVSRPTVSVHCQKIAAALKANGYNETPFDITKLPTVKTVWELSFVGGVGRHTSARSQGANVAKFGSREPGADSPASAASRNLAYRVERLADVVGPLYPVRAQVLREPVNVGPVSCGEVSRTLFGEVLRTLSADYSRACLSARVDYAERLASAAKAYGRELLAGWVVDDASAARAELAASRGPTVENVETDDNERAERLAAIRQVMPDNFYARGLSPVVVARLERADNERADRKAKELERRNAERVAS